jgi:hypothetical protein
MQLICAAELDNIEKLGKIWMPEGIGSALQTERRKGYDVPETDYYA